MKIPMILGGLPAGPRVPGRGRAPAGARRGRQGSPFDSPGPLGSGLAAHLLDLQRTDDTGKGGTNAQTVATRKSIICSLLQFILWFALAAPATVEAQPNLTVFAVTTGNNLVTFRSNAPGTILSTKAITGLQSGESILGIDFRPATGQLFALGSTSLLYIIDALTGQATAVGGPFTPALSGSAFGFDFNPVADRIRVVSDADQNLRLNPISGGVAGTDTPLAYAASDVNVGTNPAVVASAYTNNFAGATSTNLYGIDSLLDILVLQGPPRPPPTPGSCPRWARWAWTPATWSASKSRPTAGPSRC